MTWLEWLKLAAYPGGYMLGVLLVAQWAQFEFTGPWGEKISVFLSWLLILACVLFCICLVGAVQAI